MSELTEGSGPVAPEPHPFDTEALHTQVLARMQGRDPHDVQRAIEQATVDAERAAGILLPLPEVEPEEAAPQTTSLYWVELGAGPGQTAQVKRLGYVDDIERQRPPTYVHWERLTKRQQKAPSFRDPVRGFHVYPCIEAAGREEAVRKARAMQDRANR